jgi:hypothetical protein
MDEWDQIAALERLAAVRNERDADRAGEGS